jgi:starch-binding outer membrane protein, SusD/RagB family
MKNLNLKKVILVLNSVMILSSCTDLKEEVLDGQGVDVQKEKGELDTNAILGSAYNGLKTFQGNGGIFALSEMTTDALVGPTRGGDWDDNGAWRVLHTHDWTPQQPDIQNTYKDMLSNVYKCNLVIENSKVESEIVQAKFLKAFYNYNVIDLYGQLPYREIGSDIQLDPKVYTRAEATDYVISELESIISELPARTVNDPSIANKDAGHFLLAKLYLNKGVFTAADPAGPYTFAPADMDKVISNINSINSSLATNYWLNFSENNNESNELLFSGRNVGGTPGSTLRSRWHMGAHYAQTPSGWNGFTTLGEYYDRFDPADVRINYSTPKIKDDHGYNLGFQIGQMYNAKGKNEKGSDQAGAVAGTIKLIDRQGNDLVFTKKIQIKESGATLETGGIRGIKYDPDDRDDSAENDYAHFRYSDALLMKAEALARKAGGSGGAAEVNQVRARANQPPLATVDLDAIYAERGRELWWEGWRRNDMIRFGKYLNKRELKEKVSDSKYLLFPIPKAALFNPNLKQNPGY